MEELKIRKIYVHIFPDNSVYIGQTSQEKLYKRFNYGMGYDKQPDVFEQIMFWGWANVRHLILEEGMMTKEQANKKECDYTLDYAARGYKVLNRYNTENPCRYRKKEEYVYIDLLTNKRYKSLREAAADVGYSYEGIRQSIKNGTKLRNGHHFIKEIIKEEE